MSFETALRLTEVLLALAIVQSSAEHMRMPGRDRVMYALRAGLAGLLALGVVQSWVLVALCLHSLWHLHRFHGPYNGGSDRMGFLVLYAVTLAHVLPAAGAELAFGYLAVQVTLSYFMSGQIKLMNPEWRNGRALSDVFAFSAYPVSEELRGLASKRRMVWAASWAVILLELLFPLTLLDQTALMLGLGATASFHIANSGLFGLNRFVWVWLAAYPSLFWLQGRLAQVLWG